MTTSPATIHFEPDVLDTIDNYLARINAGRTSRPLSRSAFINTIMRTSMAIIMAKMPDIEKYMALTGLEDTMDVYRVFMEEVLPKGIHKLEEEPDD